MPVSWVLVCVAAVIGAGFFWRGPKLVGIALLVGALVLAVGLTDVASRVDGLRDRDTGTSAADVHEGPWVLRVHLKAGVPEGRVSKLTTGWLDLPGIGTAKAQADGTVLIQGEPRSGLVEMHAVKTALRANPLVASVERVD